MTAHQGMLRGVVHGKTVELEQEPGLPDGQSVSVVLRPAVLHGTGIERSAGAWADGGEELERWLADTRESRKMDRSQPGS